MQSTHPAVPVAVTVCQHVPMEPSPSATEGLTSTRQNVRVAASATVDAGAVPSQNNNQKTTNNDDKKAKPSLRTLLFGNNSGNDNFQQLQQVHGYL